jgi:MFS family permease
MGIGRFVYTPILPLMTAQAGLSPSAASGLATANYAGYLAGALAAVVWPRAARSTMTWRVSLVTVVVSLAAMPLVHSVAAWLLIRFVAGYASAALFVIAVDWMLDHARGRSAQLPGLGFAGVGVGIAMSGALVLSLPTAGWHVTWWAAAALAAVVAAIAWHMRPASDGGTSESTSPQRGSRFWFRVLLACYTLEGIGYIIAGTFLVAAVGQSASGGLGSSAWVVVGLAAAPSAAVWAWASTRWSRASLLVVALLLQAGGIALAALVSGPVAALIGAAAFGGTFIGISTVALAAGRMLGSAKAVAVLTAAYSVGQIVGPLLVTPLLHNGFRQALIVSAVIVLVAAATALWLRLGCPTLSRGADRPPAATSPRPQATSGARLP